MATASFNQISVAATPIYEATAGTDNFLTTHEIQPYQYEKIDFGQSGLFRQNVTRSVLENFYMEDNESPVWSGFLGDSIDISTRDVFEPVAVKEALLAHYELISAGLLRIHTNGRVEPAFNPEDGEKQKNGYHKVVRLINKYNNK